MNKVVSEYDAATQDRYRLGRGVHLIRSTSNTIGFEPKGQREYMNLVNNSGGATTVVQIECDEGSLIVGNSVPVEILTVSVSFQEWNFKKIS